MNIRRAGRAALSRVRRLGRSGARVAGTEVERVRRRGQRADLAVFHEFFPPPYGGGNQFLLALLGEFERRGMAIEVNRISGQTPSCLFNSFNFDFRQLRRFARADVRMVHRVDGPIGVYRGFDDGTDARIAAINAELADATVVQSRYSLDAHRTLKIQLAEPVLIHNSVDPSIFHAPPAREPLAERKVRLIATSWSDNPNKGADVLGWLDRNLDRSRFELTLLGRYSADFEHARVLAPLPSPAVADELRRHDLYIATSRNDPCSNALLEALACGLPTAYFDSGGHRELVGDAGLAYREQDELPEVLRRLVDEIEQRRAAIRVPALSDVADRYLDALRG